MTKSRPGVVASVLRLEGIPMADNVEWSRINSEILERLDIESAYRNMGLEIVGTKPGGSGWLSCRAKGREDREASAAINVGQGTARGRYRDLGGTGLSLSLWEFAAQFGNHGDWNTARREFAKQAGVKLPSGRGPKSVDDSLVFLPFQKSVLRHYISQKDPRFRLDALIEIGAKLARWPAAAPDNAQQGVIALPGYGPLGVDADPVAWVVVNDCGGSIRKYDGKGNPPKLVKDLCVAGSQPALLNRWALVHMDQAEVVYKVEGITDMIALQSMIPEELRNTHLVITNAFGSQETVQPHWINLLRGKNVVVIGDCDTPGQVGAARWVNALSGHAASVSNWILPYIVVGSHGPDLRDLLEDWFNGTANPDSTDAIR